ncbi:TonB-dependent receptor [Paraferrimonas sp. SM1919]|uniref:TonB-dependent receptor n=1 Tax=Paraferrimonas sp. SM1919 TaxID=2662263 RepID=UPI0013D55CB1|nr:TonB-dependent receptor [Paraferrimonas sp. SM1919]
MNKFKLSALTSALLVAGMQNAFAAEEANTAVQAQEEVEVIEVKGFRRSLQASQAEKMANDSIVEAISAEDIGKLPDVSIAESLARLPGVAAQRLDGRANVISIRGLGPDFTTATLNGREQTTVNDNRGVEFDQYPSELLNEVVVYKSSDASLMTQAVGGVVDMRTISPLAHGEQTVAVNVRGEYNDLGALNAGTENTGYRASVSYIDQFMNDTLGVAIGYSKMSSPNQEERWQAWGYPELDYDAANPLVLGGAKPYVRSSELERDGVMAVLEWAPNEQFTSTFDLFYTKFQDEQVLRGIEIPGMWGAGWANTGITAIEDDGQLVTAGIINNAAVVVRNDVNLRQADTTAVGWNNQFIVNNNLTLMADVSLSQTNRKDWGLETYSGTGRGTGNGAVDNLGFAMTGPGGAMFSHNLDYSDPSLIKLGGAFSWGNGVTVPSDGQDGFINTPEIEDTLQAIRLGANYAFDDAFVSSVDLGVNYSDRHKKKRDEGFFLTLKNYPDMLEVPAEYLLEPTSLDFIGMGNMLSYDAMGLYRSGIYTETSENATVASRANNSWDVYEKVATVFAKANLDTYLGDVRLSGNIGLQAIHTDQSSDGTAIEIKDGLVTKTPNFSQDKYWELLPSTNLNFDLTETQKVRVGVGRTMSRARLDDLNSNINLSYNQNPGAGDPNFTGSVGNTALKPWMAWNYDISYENYIGESSYFAVAAFYKNLENYIFKQVEFVDLTGVIDIPDGASPIGRFDSPQNGDGGYVKGIEASFTLSGALIHDALSGFGFIANGTMTDSEVKETPESDPYQLPGLSDRTFNATFFYEDYGFNARISSRYRSDFLGEVTAISLTRQLVNVKAETVVDAQLGYDFSESGIASLDGLSVMFQVNNLTNEPFTTYLDGNKSLVRDYQNYGRNFMFGANYKF